MILCTVLFVVAMALVAWVEGELDVPMACQREGDVALTFDGGPSMHTGQLLAILQKHNVKATFHIQPHNLDNPVLQAYVKRAANDGHLLGVHIADVGKMQRDLALAKAALKKHTGQDIRYVRLPAPMPEEKVVKGLQDSGMIVTSFNFDSLDYQSQNRSSAEESEGCIFWTFKDVFDAISPPAKGSFIAVQRDIIPTSVKATDAVIDYGKKKGFRFVRLDECLKGGMQQQSTSKDEDSDANPPPIDMANPSGSSSKPRKQNASANSAASTERSAAWLAVLIISISLLN